MELPAWKPQEKTHFSHVTFITFPEVFHCWLHFILLAFYCLVLFLFLIETGKSPIKYSTHTHTPVQTNMAAPPGIIPSVQRQMDHCRKQTFQFNSSLFIHHLLQSKIVWRTLHETSAWLPNKQHTAKGKLKSMTWLLHWNFLQMLLHPKQTVCVYLSYLLQQRFTGLTCWFARDNVAS